MVVFLHGTSQAGDMVRGALASICQPFDGERELRFSLSDGRNDSPPHRTYKMQTAVMDFHAHGAAMQHVCVLLREEIDA